MKSTFVPLLAVVTAAALLSTACGSGGPTSDGGEKPGEKVELTYWSWAPNMDKVVEGWNAATPTSTSR